MRIRTKSCGRYSVGRATLINRFFFPSRFFALAASIFACLFAFFAALASAAVNVRLFGSPGWVIVSPITTRSRDINSNSSLCLLPLSQLFGPNFISYGRLFRGSGSGWSKPLIIWMSSMFYSGPDKSTRMFPIEYSVSIKNARFVRFRQREYMFFNLIKK